MMKKYFYLLCLLSLMICKTGRAQNVVVCLGDSITRGAYLPDESTFPAQLQKILQNTTVINAGVPGNTSTAGLLRFDKDVASQHPQYIIIFFGTNDSVLRENGTYKVPLEKFTKNLQELVTRTRALNAQPILCTLLPVLPEPYFKRHPEAIYKKEGGLEAILERYRAATLNLGKEGNIPVVDLHATFSNDLSLLRPAPDGVHPTAQGAQVIAREVATAITK
jgi:lysophospholipase L1-like esterase